MLNIKLWSLSQKIRARTYLRLFKALPFSIVSKNETHGTYQNHHTNPAWNDVKLRSRRKSCAQNLRDFFPLRRTERDSFLISWIHNNLMQEHEGKEERRGAAPKGACNCSQDCIAEVERGRSTRRPRGWKTDGSVCAAVGWREIREGYTCMCVRPCASVSGRVCNTEETRIRQAALANESTRESKLGHWGVATQLASPREWLPPRVPIPYHFHSIPPRRSSVFVYFLLASSLVSISFTLRKRPPSSRYAARSA